MEQGNSCLKQDFFGQNPIDKGKYLPFKICYIVVINKDAEARPKKRN
jgi:hypothetical protein